MAATEYPVEEMPLPIDNECYTAQEDRRRFGSLVCSEGVDSFTDLRVTESAVPAMSVLVSAGGGWQLNDEGTCEGPYRFYSCDPVTVVIDANTSGSTRYDAIWMRSCDAQYSAQGSGGSIYYDPGAASSTDPTTAVVPTDDCSYYLLAIITVADGETTINGTPDAFGATETDVTDTRDVFHTCTGQPFIRITSTNVVGITSAGVDPLSAAGGYSLAHRDAAFFTVGAGAARGEVTVTEAGFYTIEGYISLEASPNGRAALWWKRDALADTNSRVRVNVGTLADVGLNFNDTGVFLPAGAKITLMASSTTTVNTDTANGQPTRLVVTKIG